VEPEFHGSSVLMHSSAETVVLTSR